MFYFITNFTKPSDKFIMKLIITTIGLVLKLCNKSQSVFIFTWYNTTTTWSSTGTGYGRVLGREPSLKKKVLALVDTCSDILRRPYIDWIPCGKGGVPWGDIVLSFLVPCFIGLSGQGIACPPLFWTLGIVGCFHSSSAMMSTIEVFSREVTVRLKAAGLPQNQLEPQMSAGHVQCKYGRKANDLLFYFLYIFF